MTRTSHPPLYAADLDPLAQWDATETARRIRAREVSALEVIDAAIARAERAAPLGAIVTATFELARDAVREPGRGGLAGVPTFVKDLAQVAGVETTWGSRAAGHYVSKRSDPFVRRFEETGVVSLGKSATPELGLTATTEALGRAPCRNPWAPSRSAGGSSGGAGCLVAAGVVPLAHGSDGGGSIRIPASCCGLVGFKPSRLRLDMAGSNMLPVNVATDGVLTRTVRDVVNFYDVLEGFRPPTRLAPIGAVAPAPSERLRIGMFVEAPSRTPVHDEVRSVTRDAGRLCESLGHHVEEIACPFAKQDSDDFLSYWSLVAWLQKSSARFTMHWGVDPALFEPWTVDLADFFWSNRGEKLQAVRRLRGFAETYATVMGSYDVLMCPTLAEVPAELGWLAPDVRFETAFERLRAYAPFTPLLNAAGAPAVSLPLGARRGLPVGVQLAAAHGHDRLLLELATELEEARPWVRSAPHDAWAHLCA
jgi:amidase